MPQKPVDFNHLKTFTLDDFNFDLPQHLIAQVPLSNRDESKLLIWNENRIEHQFIRNLPQIFPKGSLIIVNDSRVIASKLIGQKNTSTKIELLLLEKNELGSNSQSEIWNCIGKPGKKIKENDVINFGNQLTGEILKRSEGGAHDLPVFEVKLSLCGEELQKWLNTFGDVPLPPYIHRKNQSSDTRDMDRSRYQTVYANSKGSVAAPTAGLHFTNEIIESLLQNQCEIESITLHVGAGTFLPVKVQDPSMHNMHSERYVVPEKTLSSIKKAVQDQRKIIVVGTTALRCLEGFKMESVRSGKPMEELVNTWHRTNIFIHPKHSNDRYTSWFADALMTNFHQPESSLFMLICALIGRNEALSFYHEAIHHEYRFFSYGDSSLIWL
jgi:S-adenosylmethionine:tRNA ribosyltransferase-isomerase